MENNEENKIQEAEFSEIESGANKIDSSIDSSIEFSKKKKWISDFYIELILFFILGILMGVAVKTEAIKKITMGFDDYKMKIIKQDYDVNKIQADLILKKEKEVNNK